MKFREEISEHIADLDAQCFPPPVATPILKFSESDGIWRGDIWQNMKVFSLRDGYDDLVGYAAWAQPWIDHGNPDMYLIRYGIDPLQRNLGFGFLLLKYFTSEVRKSYKGMIWADVRSGHATSRRLLKKAGWTEFSEYDGSFDAETAIRFMFQIGD